MFNIFKKNKEFLSEERHLSNLQNQLDMTPQTLQALLEAGVKEGARLKVEYFFFTNSMDKAEKLGHILAPDSDEVRVGESESDKNIFVTTGWTNPIEITHGSLIRWVGEMCVLGHRNDCEFDGWGTSLDQ